VACRPIARQRSRNKQVYNSRCYVTAPQACFHCNRGACFLRGPCRNVISRTSWLVGRAVAEAVSRWVPTAEAPVLVRAGMWGLWWTKRHWVRFSPSTSVSPANHSTNFSIIIITRGWQNRPLVAAVPSGSNCTRSPNYTN
jgi:hypothetical protein